MTLATHAIVGAAAAELVPAYPVLGFVVGFASHFVIDAIPHGHYRLHSKTYHPEAKLDEDMKVKSWAFLFDLARTGIDCLTGITLALLFFSRGGADILSPFLGAIGGVLPDALQFVYWKIKSEPLTSLQRFHIWIHAKKYFYHEPVRAIFVEVATGLLAVLAVKLFVF